ncbi:MAG: tRNA dihydrouridine synthase [Hyphomicrobiales bacterium]
MNNIKIYLGPFQGITDATYRSTIVECFGGIDIAMTPFVTNVNEKKPKSVQTWDLWTENNTKVHTIPQMLSKDANEMIAVANVCEQFGYDEINWNLGCPFPRVANKKRGSGILIDPELVSSLLKEVISNINIDLSIKCRLGYKDPKELEKLIPIFNSNKIKELTIHPRIGKQLYKGTADPIAFKNYMKDIELPIVYNGDIFSVEYFQELNELFEGKINKWMLGRGILSDPFLAEKIKNDSNLSTDEKLERLRTFLQLLFERHYSRFKNVNNALNRMKELWSYLANSFDDPQKVFKEVRKCKTEEEYQKGLHNIFTNYHWVK